MRPHRLQPARLSPPWDSPGEDTGVGCHFLLQCVKVKSESQVAQSCQTLSEPMDCSPPGSSVHEIFQARVLEWGAIAFSKVALEALLYAHKNTHSAFFETHTLVCDTVLLTHLCVFHELWRGRETVLSYVFFKNTCYKAVV